jgi:hypothetical protein
VSTEDGRSGADLVRALLRWHDAGAVWRVVDRRSDRITVALLRCDGGEEVERISSTEPAWRAYLHDRSSSEE